MSAPAKAAKSPSWTEVILGALLSVLLGAVLGAVYLVLQPVPTLKAPPKEGELKADAVYYLPGARHAVPPQALAAKQRTFLGGGSIELNESEVNALVATATATKGGAKPADDGRMVRPGEPNFRIQGGVMQIGVPLEIAAPGFERTVIAQVRGRFARQGNGFALTPDEFYLGACPLHRLPFVGDYVYRRVLESAPVPAEAAIAWGNLSDVAIDGATLRLTMP
jgi:hypothetical protein